MARSMVMVLMLFAFALGCEPRHECPFRGDTRCDGSRAEICDSDLRWESFIDCDALGPGWVCCRGDEGHTCFPGDDGADGGMR